MANVYDQDDDTLNPSAKAAEETTAPKSSTNSLGSVRDAESSGAVPEEQTSSSTGGSTGSQGSSGFYSGTGSQSSRGSKKRSGGGLKRFGISRRVAIAGGGVGVGAISALVVSFLVLVPLKIENTVNMLQNHYFASSEGAVSDETDNLFDSYIEQHVLPGYKSCGTTLSRACRAVNFGTDPISALYQTWSQARIENTLASDYHIEFAYKPQNKTWYLKAPGLGSEGADIGEDGSGLGQVFNSRAEFRAAARDSLNTALESETKWKEVLVRYKVGRLLEEKYGVRRCLIFCGVTDPLRDHVDDQKIAAKLFLTQRVIGPRNNTLGIVLECFFNTATSCDPEDTQTNADPGAPAENGATESPAVDVPVSEGLRNIAASYDIDDPAALEALQSKYNDIADKGFQKWVITEGLTNIGVSTETADTTASAVPIIGWANILAQWVNEVNKASGDLKKFRFIVNGSAAVSLFSMYQTYADEVHTGHVTATELGSMNSSLGPGGGSSTDPEMGGTGDETSTPLYQYLSGDSNSSSASAVSLSNSLLGSADADSTDSYQSGNYKCNNGQPVPSGQLVCPEESLGGGNSLANSLHDAINQGGGFITTLASVWNDTVGKPFQLVGSILGSAFKVLADAENASCSLPGGVNPLAAYCAAEQTVKTYLPKIINDVANNLIPDPFSTNMSGGRTFDMMAAGADVSGNDYAHEGLGGKQLTSSQATAIINAQQEQQQEQFEHEPLFARLFSGSSTYSLISKVSMDMPSDFLSGSADSFASIVSNPFGPIFNGFSSLFTSKVSADSPNVSDPFGVPQYGYTQQDLDAIGDPVAYWDAHCTDNSSTGYQKDNSYNNAAVGTQDSSTGEPVNTQTDPCELLMAAVGSDGGSYNTDLLTKDDLADLYGSSSSSSTAPTPSSSGYTDPFHGSKNLVYNRVDEGVDFATDSSVPIYAIGSGIVTEATESSSFYTTSAGHADWITYQLSSGPAKGKFVYVAEGCSPVLVHATEIVGPNTQLCTVLPDSIETGWAVNATEQAAAAINVYQEGNATAYGQNFEELLTSLGVNKACYDHPGEALEGALPPGWPQWVTNPATKAGGNQC
ncbi:MAG TPA: hypothetical protein VL989_03745 [Candidatus Sulfotelmatobacter sp.]|nr:hypothetical protein [Candidatus Sulfotelmatobacter sp.]